MRCRFSTLFSAAFIVLMTAYSPATAQDIPVLSDDARVSLITILPGEDVYSTFGHSAIRVVDPALGIDESYNYGTFDFGSSAAEIAGFIGRFTYGDLDYRLSIQLCFQHFDALNQLKDYWANPTSEHGEGEQHPHREDITKSESVHGTPLRTQGGHRNASAA